MLGVVDIRDLTIVAVSLSPLWVVMSFIPGASVVAGGKVVGTKKKKNILQNETTTEYYTTITPYPTV